MSLQRDNAFKSPWKSTRSHAHWRQCHLPVAGSALHPSQAGSQGALLRPTCRAQDGGGAALPRLPWQHHLGAGMQGGGGSLPTSNRWAIFTSVPSVVLRALGIRPGSILQAGKQSQKNSEFWFTFSAIQTRWGGRCLKAGLPSGCVGSSWLRHLLLPFPQVHLVLPAL